MRLEDRRRGRMKLAFVVKTLDSRGGGAERVLTEVTSALARLGHDVTMISMGTAEERDFYPVDLAIQRVWLGAGKSHARSSAVDVVKRIAALRSALIALRPDVA